MEKLTRRFVLACLSVLPAAILGKGKNARAENSPAAERLPAILGVLPSGFWSVPPYRFVKDFATGYADLLQSHVPALNDIIAYLNSHPLDVCILIGQVSDLRISGDCYVKYDEGYFSLHTPCPGSTRLTGNLACQSALAFCRAINVRRYLLSRGIVESRVRILDYVAVGLQQGGNYPNQAVASWMIAFDPAVQNQNGIINIYQWPNCQPVQITPFPPANPTPTPTPRPTLGSGTVIINYGVDP